MLISAVAVGGIRLAPNDAGKVAVIFAPWVGSAEAMSRAASAGASVVGVGRYPFIVIVQPEGGGYLLRVMSEGAWSVLDPRGFAACPPKSADLS